MKTTTTAAILGISTGLYAFARVPSTTEFSIAQALEKIVLQNHEHLFGIINAYQIYTQDSFKNKIKELAINSFKNLESNGIELVYKNMLEKSLSNSLTFKEFLDLEQEYAPLYQSYIDSHLRITPDLYQLQVILYLHYCLEENNIKREYHNQDFRYIISGRVSKANEEDFAEKFITPDAFDAEIYSVIQHYTA
ncbi:MAG TPA: hypothetical protein DCL21_03665 [Alphaproteobacteria bacterium]|nr:hypothetical protein [Alphaproteobacteria bacterium]